MNRSVLILALAVILFVCAYLPVDLYDWTQLAISTVLFLSGVHSLFVDSESLERRRLGRSCLRLAAIISVFFILKLIIFG